MAMKYTVSGNQVGSWQVMCDGEEVATVSGPMSGCVALAAMEHLNSFGDRASEKFFAGWTRRLMTHLEANRKK